MPFYSLRGRDLLKVTVLDPATASRPREDPVFTFWKHTLAFLRVLPRFEA